MDVQALAEYLVSTHNASNDAWSEPALRQLSNRRVPQEVVGTQAWLLEADARLTWTRWFVDGLINQARYVRDENLGYSHLYFDAQEQLQLQLPTVPLDELRLAAKAVAELAWDEISRRRKLGRQRISQQVREDLWFAAEPSPRCYLCGYLFDAHARERLLGREESVRRPATLPMLVDFTRPRGVSVRDITVEVDHVAPVSSGGQTMQTNLRLACGWCNRVKSNRTSLYEASALIAGTIVTRELGKVAVPQPLWVLRIVATRGRCEHPSGCLARLDSHELYIAPRNLSGTLNPVNALVYCAEHDPWATARLVGRSTYK